MWVKGTVLVEFRVEVDAEDISEDAMSMYESDEILAREINMKLPSGFYVEGDIRVIETKTS
jgi:hypothetical protein